jgi:hypothetical protein
MISCCIKWKGTLTKYQNNIEHLMSYGNLVYLEATGNFMVLLRRATVQRETAAESS